MYKINKKNGICYICGKNKAITKDHIPPKCIFPESLKQFNVRKITVWACKSCNNTMSKIDEQVRDYLSVCIFTGFREEMWQKAKKKLINVPKVREEMIKNMIEVTKTKIPQKYIKNGATHAIILPKNFDEFIKRLFKGFHSHFTDVIITNDFYINIWQYPKESIDGYLKYVNCHYIIKDVLVLFGAISPDKKMSIWWLQIYNNPLYICVIAPKEILKGL